jgi:hypothetical protein
MRVIVFLDLSIVRGPHRDQHFLEEAAGKVEDGLQRPDHLQKNSLRNVQQVSRKYGHLCKTLSPSFFPTFFLFLLSRVGPSTFSLSHTHKHFILLSHTRTLYQSASFSEHINTLQHQHKILFITHTFESTHTHTCTKRFFLAHTIYLPLSLSLTPHVLTNTQHKHILSLSYTHVRTDTHMCNPPPLPPHTLTQNTLFFLAPKLLYLRPSILQFSIIMSICKFLFA